MPTLTAQERERLASYAARFNAHDFDTVRAMLADDVRLELVNRKRLNGRGEVGNYFHNYSKRQDWHLVAGLVEGRPAVLVYDPGNQSAAPVYFVLLEWAGNGLVRIRDFRYARYAVEGADFWPLGEAD